jgi:hypothetical protein
MSRAVLNFRISTRAVALHARTCPEGGGTTVTIEFPLRTSDRAQA